MARKCFFSFHFDADAWRAAQVRQMGVVENDEPVKSNDWEEVKKGGDDTIKKWIDDQMSGKSCVVVLVGASTASRPWVKHEIGRAWELKKGLVGISIHGLKNAAGNQASQGKNPFTLWNVGQTPMSNIVKLHTPPFSDSKDVYANIHDNIAQWVEDAITLRANYGLAP